MSSKSLIRHFIFLSTCILCISGLPFAPGVNTQFNFNEGTGTNAADLSGNGHNATLVNGPVWTTGKYGQAISLDGSNDYVNIPDHNDYTLTSTQSYTWSAWIRNNNFNSWGTVWSQTLDANNYFYFYSHSTTDQEAGPVTNGLTVYWYTGNGNNKLVVHSNDNVLSTGTWSYVTVTYDGSLAQASRFTIYVNGTDVTNRSDIESLGTISSINPTNIRIGSNQPFGEYLNAAVDEARYYTRLLSIAEIQSDMNTPIDNTAPTINITAPANGSTINTTVNVTANASDNVGVAGVQFLLDGVNLGAEDVDAPYAVSWNTTTATDGSHSLTAKARDLAGNITTSSAVAVTVNNDLIAPTISITSPVAGVINGTVNVNADANDNTGVAGVQFLLNGVNLTAEDIAAPYSFSWNTTGVADGQYVVAARARDAAGNTTTASVNVTVHNLPDTQAPSVTLTSPSAGIINGTVNVNANASDNIGVAGVQFLLNGAALGTEDVTAPYSFSWNTNSVADGHYTLSARARDIDGNTTTTTAINITVYNQPDTQAPSLALTAPSAGIVTGVVSVNANADDNIAVAGVQFLLNGSNLGAEDVTVPYSFSWNTNNVADGNYIVAARARDLAGNITTTANISVTVKNDAQLPTVSITSPAAGTVAGTITVSANASDNMGVAGVQFQLNGSNLGTEDMTAPYSISWNTRTISNGSYTLTAKARDASGNIQTSAPVVVNVQNLPPDNEYPVINITSPLTGSVSGIINVTANATDNVGVAGVQFFLNGSDFGAEDMTAPYTVSWNTYTVANGSYSLTAMARDAAGNITISDAVTFNINNPPDNTVPAVSITSPAAGNVTGTINIMATASDNIAVAGVQFYLDGSYLGAEDISSPYSKSWNSITTTAGNHTISARARDAAGNTSLITYININVLIPTAPVITGISVNPITESSAVINWTTNVKATSQVNYDTAISYKFSTLVDNNLVIAHSVLLTGLTPGKLHNFQILSTDSAGLTGSSVNNTFTTANMAATLGTLNQHTIFAYPAGKIIPWTPNPSDAYSTVMELAWNYLLNSVPNDPLTGKPAYYSRSYINPNTQQMVNWDHNPAGLYAMLVESALKYYMYSGNANVMQLANDVALWHLDHGMTSIGASWPGVPYSEGAYGSLTYSGAAQSDGVGNLEPDKIGALGHAWFQLYKFNGNTRFRDAAIQAANVLASKVRVGNLTQSPWPFRVNASSGTVVEEYCANVIQPIELFDDLIAAGLGNTAAYQTARITAWNWMMTYPMQNNVWAQYFEDVSVQPSYNTNLNQLVAGMTARYLIEHPETDANWETHARGIIAWIENIFGQTQYGALAIKEQVPEFPYLMGSHTSRYASLNALLFEKKGDVVAKEKAYRSFNWATYMCRSNGVVIDGLLYGSEVNANQWFTDGYGDYVRHFMTGLGAIPEWSPANQTHLLRSSSLVKAVTYTTNSISYTTYDSSSVEVLHVNFNPAVVTADGVVLQKRTDLNEPGWTLDFVTKTLRIYHKNATKINVSAVSFNVLCPGSSTYFSMIKPGNDYTYQWQVDSTGNGFVNLVSTLVHPNVNSDTLWFNEPPTSSYGYRYRCIATKNGVPVYSTQFGIKFSVTWEGDEDNTWNNTANWSCGYTPDAFTDVIIPNSATNNPVIGNNASARSIIVSPGTTLTIGAGVKLDIKGK